jgi:hypothetical protein
VACADLDGWRSGDLEEIIRLAQQHGYGDEARYASMRKNIANFFGFTPGTAGGIGIGERVASPPLPQHRTCGSAYGVSAD